MCDMRNSEKVWHQKLINLLTLPVSCSHFTGWAKKVIPRVHILHCTRGITFLARPVCWEIQKESFSTILLIRTSDYLRYLRIKRTVAVTMPQLECQASNVTANVQSDHLLHGSTPTVFSPLISLIVHHAVLKFSPCLVSTNRYRNSSVLRIHTIHTLLHHALPDLDQDCWLATCHDWWTGLSHGAVARLCHEHNVLVRRLARR